MQAYTLSSEKVEEAMDIAKSSILRSLVKENIIAADVAEEWGKIHTVILKQKSVFHSVIDKVLSKDSKDDITYFLVVKITS